MRVCAVTVKTRRWYWILQELELQVVGSCPMWALVTDCLKEQYRLQPAELSLQPSGFLLLHTLLFNFFHKLELTLRVFLLWDCFIVVLGKLFVFSEKQVSSLY